MSPDRVLLVDDEEDFVGALARRLEARGLSVATAGSGEQAIDQLGKHDFDVVVLDLAMPGMDGIDTLKRIKEIDPELQVILLTGHGTVAAGVEAMKLGALDFLEKPATFDDLLAKIREAGARRMVLVQKRREEQVTEILRGKGW